MNTNKFSGAAVWPLTLMFIAVWSVTAARETAGQIVYISIATRTVEGFSKPGVKVWIGTRSVVTATGGVGSLEMPPGTYTARAETKCRVVRASISPTIDAGGSETQPRLTLTLHQPDPLGILFELDCSKVQTRGKTKPKTTTKKRP